ncbi:MAG: hypothetical protein KDA32_13315 [Phycisphaerales bacterium]|nr:hypothetical protein [Phycisphaerales bacterium]
MFSSASLGESVAISARFAPRVRRLVSAMSHTTRLTSAADDQGRCARLAPAEPIDVALVGRGWRTSGVLCDIDARGARLSVDDPPPAGRARLSIRLATGVWEGSVEVDGRQRLGLSEAMVVDVRFCDTFGLREVAGASAAVGAV